jgi:hypothetical protein
MSGKPNSKGEAIRNFSIGKMSSKKGALHEKDVVKIVNRMINSEQEQKYYDTTLNNIAVDSTGLGSIFSLIPQGTTDSTRDADQVTPKSLELRLKVVASGSSAGNAVRIIIGQLRGSVTGAVVASTILSTSGVTNASLLSLNHDNWFGGAFDIFSDTVTNVDIYNPTFVVNKKWNLGPKNRIVFNAGTTNAIGHIFMIAISDVATVTPQISFTARLNYTDS